jgi:hypothetical protein
MQTLSTDLAAALVLSDGTNDPVQRRGTVLYEIYPYDYYPAKGEGFDPVNAVPFSYRNQKGETKSAVTLFSEVGVVWMGRTYDERVLSRSAISRFISSDFNRCDLTFANGDLMFSGLVLNQEVEGMRLVIRYVDQSLPGVLSNSIVIFVGRLEKPSSVTETVCAISAAQDLATINYEIPKRTFSSQDPEGRSPGDLEYEGFQFTAQHGAFKTLEVVTKRFLGFFTKKKTVEHSQQWSTEEGTSQDQVVPLIFGRTQMELIPVLWADTGFFIVALWVAAGHKISAITNIICQTAGFIGPSDPDVITHLGDVGGTGTNATVDSHFPSSGWLGSRTAYAGFGLFGPEDPTASAANAGQDAVPTATAIVLGEAPLPDGSNDFVDDGFTDNPAYLTRLVLTDPDICGLDERLIDDDECVLTAALCDEILIDDTSAEILALSTVDADALTNGLFRRFNSSGVIDTKYQRYALGDAIDPPWSTPRLDVLPVEPPTDDSCPAGQHLDLVTNTCVPDDSTGLLAKQTFYRKRYTANAPLTAKLKAVDFLYIMLAWFRGWLSISPSGRIQIKTERPADSTFLRDAASAGATSIAVNDIEPWRTSKQGLILIDPGSVTSEARVVTNATYSAAGDDVTLVGAGTGITLTGSAGTLGGGSTTVPYSATLTVSGTPNAGDLLTATIDGIVVVYALTADDALNSAAAMLCAAINATWSLRQYVRATVSGAVVTVYSKLGNLTLSSGLTHSHVALLDSPTAAPTASAVSGGAMRAGFYDSAYSYKSPTGETFVSPTTRTTLTAGQRISQGGISLPTGCVGLNWYLSKAPNDPTMALLVDNVGAAFYMNSIPEPDADPVPIGNGAGEETIRVMASFTKDNIRQDAAGEGKFKWPLADRTSSINQILIKYREASAGFAERELYVNDKRHQQRIGAINKEEIDGSGVDNYMQAFMLANNKLSKRREGNFYCGWTTDEAGIAFEEGDVICISDDTGGFVNLPLRIEDIQIQENLDVDFIGGLYSTIMYSDQTGQHPISIPTNLRYLNNAPAAPTSLVLEEVAVTATSSTVRGTFEFAKTPAAQVGRVFIKRDGDSTYSDTGLIVPPEAPAVDGDPFTGSFEIAGLPPGTHDIKILAEARGRQSALTSPEPITSTVGGTITITHVFTNTIEATGDVGIGGRFVAGTDDIEVTNTAGNVVPAAIAGYPSDATQFLNGNGGWSTPASQPLFLAADLVNSTTAFANITDLSAPVLAGRKYSFRATLFINDSNAEGVKFDLNGGTATSTNLRATYLGWDTALSLIMNVTTLAAVASVDSFSGVGKIEIEGTFEPATDGTFVPRMAQLVHTSGSLTVLRGSSLVVQE